MEQGFRAALAAEDFDRAREILAEYVRTIEQRWQSRGDAPDQTAQVVSEGLQLVAWGLRVSHAARAQIAGQLSQVASSARYSRQAAPVPPSWQYRG